MTDNEFDRQGGSNFGRSISEAQTICNAICIGEHGAHIDLRLARLEWVAQEIRAKYQVDTEVWDIDLGDERSFEGTLIEMIAYIKRLAAQDYNVVSLFARAV
jgi:hypothetical protein